MLNLKDILTIIFSSIIGASSSMVITILSNRRMSNSFFDIFYSLKINGLVIGCLILFLLILSKIRD
jgi:hypothetical protein